MKIPLLELTLPKYDLRASQDEDQLDELAASMRDHGQLQAIGVKPGEIGGYEVVFGARRTRAATLLGWDAIEGNLVDDRGNNSANASKLIENVQRLNLTPMEEAYGLADLIGEGEADIRQLQRATGKSREWVRTRLDLIDLPDDIQGAVQAGVIGIGVARAFGQIQNPEVREQYVKMALENGCTADQAVVWASQARFAENGIMTMDEVQRSGIDINNPSGPVDQHYPCFVCTTVTNWRRVNVLPVCGGCQDAICSSRTVTIAHPPPSPLAPDIELM